MNYNNFALKKSCDYMKLEDVIFIDNLPTIDLHGFDSETARVAINDFISDNYKMKNSLIIIIHGIGSGTLRKVTFDALSKNKKILKFKTYYYNNGCTIAEININNVEKC